MIYNFNLPLNGKHTALAELSTDETFDNYELTLYGFFKEKIVKLGSSCFHIAQDGSARVLYVADLQTKVSSPSGYKVVFSAISKIVDDVAFRRGAKQVYSISETDAETELFKTNGYTINSTQLVSKNINLCSNPSSLLPQDLPEFTEDQFGM